ncbi:MULTISPECIES: NF038104 family lipoprotein [unclassified Moraxella]|uniref:NF038104 family lipoprotein n=1 Tax=unclassified Moraxella TaxID=2685852 RepID=UPI003AF5C49E
MKKLTTLALIITTAFILQGCVHKIVTVPVKVAYKTTKALAKGTIAVGKAIIPGDSDDKKKD